MGDLGSIDVKDVVTLNSGHAAPGPPAVSAIMPPPPPSPTGPCPVAPFMYIARSAKAQKGSCGGSREIVEGQGKVRVLRKDTAIDIEQPGNMPSKPTDPTMVNKADQVSKVIVGLGLITDPGQSTVLSGKKPIAVTGAICLLNIPSPNSKLHQSESPLLGAGDVVATQAGDKANPCKVVASGDPVAVASGVVVDEVVDLRLCGVIDVELRRLYASARHKERSSFGRGGWTHNFQRFVEPTASGELSVVGGDGRRLVFPALAKGATALLRGRGLELERRGERYLLRELDTALGYEFERVEPGGLHVLARIRDAWDNRVELVHEGGRLARLVDTARRELHFAYDDQARIVRIEVWARNELQVWHDYGYGEAGELASATDALGHVERYGYDAKHRLVAKTARNGLTFRYEYDRDTGRCVRSRGDGNLQNVELEFDDRERTTAVHGNPEPRLYSYTTAGDVTREATYDGAWLLASRYDDDQLCVAQANAAGESRSFAYDARGRLVKYVRPDGAVFELEREHDRPVKRTDPDGAVHGLSYDGRGAPVECVFPTGRRERYGWDEHGRLLHVDCEGQRLAGYAHDDEHNIVAVTNGAGATHHYAYDAMGRMICATDPLGRVTRVAYDRLGRPTHKQMPDGTRLAFAYDPVGNLVREVDQTGRTTEYAHLGAESIARVVAPDGGRWEVERDGIERVVGVTNPKGERWEYEYDRAGRMIAERTFDGRALRYAYAAHGRHSRTELGEDHCIEYAYDEAGFLVGAESPHGNRRFVRDKMGRVVEAVVAEHDGERKVELAWDADGRLVAQASDGAVVRYEYDTVGWLRARTLPNGETTRYYHDGAGSLVGIEHEGEKVLLQRDTAGREVRRYFYASGLDLQLGYDGDDRLVVQRAAVAGGPTLVQREWVYEAHARPLRIADARWGGSEYEHDPCGRLVAATRAGVRRAFAYDEAGSLVADSAGLGAGGPWTLGPGGRVLRAGDVAYRHDALGRRVRKLEQREGVAHETAYLWDAWGQLREVILPGGARVRFWYDAFGRRVQKAVLPPPGLDGGAPDGARVTRYVWDRNELALEVESSGAARTFVHEPRSYVPILQRQGGASFACITDHVGVPRELVDGHGRVAWAARFEPFGALAASQHDPAAAAVASPFRLLGQYADDETGLHYARFRYHDPATGRWLSPDPEELRGGPNVFAYDGSPVRDVDPLGLMSANRFQQFLDETHGPRRQAHAAAGRLQRRLTRDMGPREGSTHTTSATASGRAAHNQRTGNPEDHAERRMGPLGGEVVGAGRPHCGSCTTAILSQGGITASPIRGSGDNAWNPPRPAAGSPPDPSW